ncbi:flagellar hook-associated protein 2 [Pseudomonas duriflava]|uniref:Flagellar hook-associated protein 2 n=1 Tax=Pseudomonas duriflava TaxID=459528 RepID=A0A562PRH1_9PSED|nr:flagellar filament capping protein FliD [Pseudomonas duriflava]TWI47045.1 flagellar hook-associated protein 2 [Pseudomonas duriflava]
MANITLGSGFNSGLDIQSIVSALVSADRAPKDAQLSRLETATTAKISSLGTLKSSLSEFQTSLKNLNDIDLFNQRTATSSDSARVTATTSTTAAAGVYSLEVIQLASSSKISSGAIAGDSSATFSQGGTLVIGRGSDSYNVSVADGASLKDIRDNINSQLKSNGVTANIVTDPSTNKSRLVLSSDKGGTGNDLTLTTSNAGLEALADSVDGSRKVTTTLQLAVDAKFKVDGLELSSASNEVAGVVEGVVFNLVKAESNQNVTVTVGENTTGVKEKIKSFVDSYNKLISTTNTLTSVIAVGDGKQPQTGNLVGDSSVRSLLSKIRGELTSQVEGPFRVLADLGVTTQKDGKLAIDDEKLSSALSDNYDSVGSFLAGTNGLMQRLSNSIDGYVKSGGLLEQRVNGLQTTLRQVDEQKIQQEARAAALEERLLKQFNAMDALVGQMSNTSSSLLATLSSINS